MSSCHIGIFHAFIDSCVSDLSMQAEMLTGSVVTNVEEARGAAQELLKRGCKSVIITLGPQGCVVVQAQDSTSKHVPTTAVKAIDTTVSSIEQGNDTIIMGGKIILKRMHFFA